ncbi:MAG: glycosyltransferase [Halanaerobiales bacterium]|nr:glycosyltransferase [Halanaerobiales bacterium]
MNKGTVIYIGGFQLPDKNAAAHRVLNNGLVLKEIGYKMVYIGVSKIKDNNDLYPYDVKHGFTAWDRSYPSGILSWLKYLINIDYYVNIIEKYSNIKYIICYNFPSLALSKIIRYCKKRNISVVSDITEWYGAQGENMVTKIIKGVDSFYRMRILNKKVNHLIVISEFLEKYYSKQSVIKIPPLVSQYNNCNKSKPLKYPIKLLYFGNPGLKKDRLDIIIDDFYRSGIDEKQVALNILGLDKKVFLEKNSSFKHILQVLSNVHFLGKVEHSKVAEILEENDYSIIVRKNNIVNNAGFPTKFVESVSNCTPVITTDVGEVKSYVERYNCGLIIEENIKKTLKNVSKIDKIDAFDSSIFYYKKYIHIFELIFR